ncbi:hypothetical protein GCM10022248_40370 [Nonomuraea soli]
MFARDGYGGQVGHLAVAWHADTTDLERGPRGDDARHGCYLVVPLTHRAARIHPGKSGLIGLSTQTVKLLP